MSNLRSVRTALVAVAVVMLALAVPTIAGADFKEAQKRWKDGLKKRDTGEVTAAAAELGASGDKKAVALLLGGIVHPDEEIYDAVVDALAEIARNGGDAAAELAKKATRGKGHEQVAIVDALSRAPDAPDAVKMLAELLEDKDQSVRVAAIRAFGKIQRKDGVDPLIAHLKRKEDKGGQEVDETRRALTAITGAEFSTGTDWENFWEPRKEEFDPKEKVEMRGETVERGPKFFGSEVLSKRVVLVLDVSNSMRVIDARPAGGGEGGSTLPPAGGAGGMPGGGAPRDPGVTWPPDPNSRFARARDETIQFIAALEKDVAFNVIVFSDEVKYWQATNLIPANKKAKVTAIEWVKGIQWGPATRTDLAVEKAFEIKGADTFYILSDGNPEKPGNVPIPTDEIMEKVSTLNRFRKVAVHTMGFPGQHRAFLEKLAKENGGTYKDIR